MSCSVDEAAICHDLLLRGAGVYITEVTRTTFPLLANTPSCAPPLSWLPPTLRHLRSFSWCDSANAFSLKLKALPFIHPSGQVSQLQLPARGLSQREERGAAGRPRLRPGLVSVRAVCSSRARSHAPEEDSLAYAQRHGAVHQAVISDRYLQSDQLPFLRESTFSQRSR